MEIKYQTEMMYSVFLAHRNKKICFCNYVVYSMVDKTLKLRLFFKTARNSQIVNYIFLYKCFCTSQPKLKN